MYHLLKKIQEPNHPKKLDKDEFSIVAKLFISELFRTNNSIEQYSTEELFMELERRILKKDDL